MKAAEFISLRYQNLSGLWLLFKPNSILKKTKDVSSITKCCTNISKMSSLQLLNQDGASHPHIQTEIRHDFLITCRSGLYYANIALNLYIKDVFLLRWREVMERVSHCLFNPVSQTRFKPEQIC